MAQPAIRVSRAVTVVLAADPAGIARAAGLLRAGRLVGFGTETVYGLGGDGRDPGAVAAIYAAKGRPAGNPLICHYASAEAVWGDVVADERARALAAAFWPGPLTLVLARAKGCGLASRVSAGLNTVAVRVPGHPAALALIAAVGGPVAAPSANLSGRVSPTEAAHVLEGLGGRIDAVLDCGPCRLGLESTVIGLDGTARLLRAGAIPVATIAALIGAVADAAPGRISGPGQLGAHYAPLLPLRLGAVGYRADEGLLAFGPAPAGAGPVFQLSAAGDVDQAAARLFAGLRWLDGEGLRLGRTGLAAMAVPAHGVGAAINDRLRRAACGEGS